MKRALPHPILSCFPFLLTLLLTALPLRAELRSARWEVSPTPPLYAGQTCELRLLIETAPEEEVASLLLSAGPKDRRPDHYDARKEADRRVTVCTWNVIAEPDTDTLTIPAARLRARIVEVKRYGFRVDYQDHTEEITVPAFTCAVEPLPGDAAGLPIGDFALSLAAVPSDPRPGDVIRLRAKATAREGALPTGLTFALDGAPAGEARPFRVLRATPQAVEAEAYYALPDRPLTETLMLAPLRAFDLTVRTAADVPCPPLTLVVRERPEPADDSPAKEGAPLRFAPDDNAPAVGALAADRRVLETRGAWSRLAGGWIRTAALKAEPPATPASQETP